MYHARSVYTLYCIIAMFVTSGAYVPATHFTSFAFPHVLQPGIDVMSFIKRGGRLIRPEHCPEEVYTIMRLCWADEPRDRPMFKQLLEQLTKLAQSA